jgi:hypothetical protein
MNSQGKSEVSIPVVVAGIGAVMAIVGVFLVVKRGKSFLKSPGSLFWEL